MREQPAPEVTADDIRMWLDADRQRLRRLKKALRSTPLDEVLAAEIQMVSATIKQLEAELNYLNVIERHRAEELTAFLQGKSDEELGQLVMGNLEGWSHAAIGRAVRMWLGSASEESMTEFRKNWETIVKVLHQEPASA